MKFYDCYTIMAGKDSCCSMALMTIKTRDPNFRDPNFNVAFRPIASFRCDARFVGYQGQGGLGQSVRSTH
jgi:hypothetical protein